jgi:hypothetical protein
MAGMNTRLIYEQDTRIFSAKTAQKRATLSDVGRTAAGMSLGIAHTTTTTPTNEITRRDARH